MKEKEEKEEETAPLKNTHINDLLEPLVKEENPTLKKRLFESVIIPSEDYIYDNKNEINFNIKENKIKKIRNELNDLDKDTEDSSNYSNIPTIEALKCQNFLFIIILTILSSLQFGIFLFIANLYLRKINAYTNGGNLNQNKFYIFFLVLSWKYQIYFFFYIIYGLIVFFKTKKSENNNDKNDDSIPLIKNNSQDLFDINPAYNFRKFKYRYLMKFGSCYSSYFNIFFYTSNIFNYPKEKSFFENFLNLDDILRGISGLIFSYTLFYGSNLYYFGILYLIQSITAMIPYYIKFNYNSKQNSNNNSIKNNTKYFKYIFPLLTSIGIYFLLKSISNNGINNYNNYLNLFIILLVCILCQIYSQKQFVQKSYYESPFHILFKNYFIFFLLSNSIVLFFEIIFNLFNLRNLFFWMTDIYIFIACFIGFGVLGSIYHMLLTLIRIALSNNVIIKLIKYFNLFIIDLVGIFIFRQYDIIYKIDYFMGVTLCAISLFLLDFCDIL